MLFLVYVIKDVVTGEFSSPILAHNVGDLKRQFFGKISNLLHKADYQAYVVGDYDSSSGVIRTLDMIDYICGGSDSE